MRRPRFGNPSFARSVPVAVNFGPLEKLVRVNHAKKLFTVDEVIISPFDFVGPRIARGVRNRKGEIGELGKKPTSNRAFPSARGAGQDQKKKLVGSRHGRQS